jgi:hypothetical protein
MTLRTEIISEYRCCLLGYDAEKSGRSLLKFQTILLPVFSVLNKEAAGFTETLVAI